MKTLASPALEITLLTPPGRGALAVVRVRGPGAVDLVARCFTPRGRQSLADRPEGAIIFGRWGDPARGEELVVVRHAANWLEVHCHGGLAASGAVMASLTSSVSPGMVSAEPSPLAPSHSPLRATIEAEARASLARVGGLQAARILCRQLAGALADELERIESLWQAGDEVAATAATARLRQASRVGLRLEEPWRVVVSGPVNAGKSSLVNALAGYARSIVSSEPGTTRDVVTTRLVLGGWEIDLIDTAGLRKATAAVSATERAGIERAQIAAATADLVLEVFPTHERPTTTDSQPLSTGPRPSLRIFAKCDLASDIAAPSGTILTSARTGMGIDALSKAIIAALVPEETTIPSILTGPVPFTPRQMAALRIRSS